LESLCNVFLVNLVGHGGVASGSQRFGLSTVLVPMFVGVGLLIKVNNAKNSRAHQASEVVRAPPSQFWPSRLFALESAAKTSRKHHLTHSLLLIGNRPSQPWRPSSPSRASALSRSNPTSSSIPRSSPARASVLARADDDGGRMSVLDSGRQRLLLTANISVCQLSSYIWQ
jgi:hypothetical protein